MCDHCLAPDTSSGAGIGCDNMTVLIVALLHGRTKEEWAAWVTDRVKNNYGYKTPTTLPQLYSQNRLMGFRIRREAQEARDRSRQQKDDSDDGIQGLLGGSGLGGFARVLGGTGGLSFKPGVGSDSINLMFGDEGDDSSDEEMPNHSFFTDTLLGRPDSPDSTQQLQAHLHEFEKEIRDGEAIDDDDDSLEMEISGGDVRSDEGTNQSNTNSIDSNPHLQGEAPPPPKLQSNGDASTSPVEQLKSTPHGDEPLPVVKAEGLLDSSEDPLVKA